MKPGLQAGLDHEFSTDVTAEMVISFLGPDVTPTLSTPSMTMAMEHTARLLLQPYLEADESSVGTSVHIRHLAPTPVGMRITATARLTEVDGRRCSFAVECRDAFEKVGEGTHERFIIHVPRFVARIDAKRAR